MSPAAKRPAPAPAPKGPVSVYLVCGDEYLVSAKAKELVAQLCPPEQQTLGLEVVDGGVDTVDAALAAMARCLEALATVGFFGAARTVWLRGASFFTDAQPGKSAEVKERVNALAQEIKRGLVEGQKLVVSAPRVDKRSAFYKACQAHGSVIEFEIPDKPWLLEQHARETLRHLLADAGLTAGSDALEALLARAGTDTRQLAQEVRKLSCYLGERKRVAPEDVQDIVSPTREAVAWDLADAVGRRDLAAALRLYRNLIFQREAPVGLVIQLENRFRDLIVYREGLDQRWVRAMGEAPWVKVEWVAHPEADRFLSALANDPRAGSPYLGGRLVEQARRYSMSELVRGHQLLLEAHERMVSGNVPAELVLELCLVNVMGGPRRASA